MFCTYLTIYKGNMLPPYYIGSSTVENVHKGYRGSVLSKRYKDAWASELRDHPDLFRTFIISTHITRTDAREKERKLHDALNVVANPMYINMAKADGSGRFGGGFVGMKHTDEHKETIRKKMLGRKIAWEGKKRPDHAERMKGEKNPNYGCRGALNPIYGKPRLDRFCCLGCRHETINSNLRHHIKCHY